MSKKKKKKTKKKKKKRKKKKKKKNQKKKTIHQQEQTMKLTIATKKENSLLQRTEVQAKLLFEGATPKNIDVAAAIAKALSTDVPNVVVKKITTTFGKQEA